MSPGLSRVSPAELSSLLWRGVSYEVPALRRQLGRCQQAQQELARREDESQLRATELRERFLASCRQYGIAVSAAGRGSGHGEGVNPNRVKITPNGAGAGETGRG